MCTKNKNNDHMIYGFWNMVRDGRTDGGTEGNKEVT